LLLPVAKFQSVALGAEFAGPLNSSLHASVQLYAATIGASMSEKNIIASKQAKLMNDLALAPVLRTG